LGTDGAAWLSIIADTTVLAVDVTVICMVSPDVSEYSERQGASGAIGGFFASRFGGGE
jgi:hypothetical protein